MGKKGATALKSGCTGILFLFWGNSGLVYPACALCFCLSACFVSASFCLLLQEKNEVIIFLRAEANIGVEKKTNRDANRVDEERNRRASIFLPVNSLKTSTSRFHSIAMHWG